MIQPVLEVDHLTVRFSTDSGVVHAVSDVSFNVARGETLALVGESGSGKSVTSLALLRLTPDPPLCTVQGRVTLRDASGGTTDVLSLPENQMRDLRGSRIAMIFQEPMTALNPVLTIGEQVDGAADLSSADVARDGVARGGGPVGSGGHSGAATAAGRLSAPIVGRNAAARDDRDGSGVQSGPVDR